MRHGFIHPKRNSACFKAYDATFTKKGQLLYLKCNMYIYTYEFKISLNTMQELLD